MPQWIANFLSPDSRAPMIAAIVVGIIVATLILFFLYRLVFGHRLRLPGGGRARQPRLGLVDAFWLDGQRQLVLVRRDSVENLLMIGWSQRRCRGIADHPRGGGGHGATAR